MTRERGPDASFGPSLCAWCIEPAGFVTRLEADTILTAAMARWICEDVHRLARARRRGSGPLRVYNDFGGMSRYEPEARRVCTDWAMDNRQDIEILQVTLAPRNRMVSMGIHVAAMSLRMAGLQVQIDDEVPEAVYGLLRAELQRESG